MVLKVRKDFRVFKQAWFIVKWFNVIYCDLTFKHAVLTTTEENEAAF